MTKTTKIIIAIIALAVIIGGVWYFGGEKTSQKESPVKIGFLGPLSGDTALYGVNPKKGAQLAVEEINSSGGIKEKRLKLISEDSKCNPKEGVSSFNKLINVDKTDYLIGGMCSSVTLAIAPSANKEKVVTVSPVSTHYKISDAGDYIFRTVPSDALQGKKGAELAYQKGYRKAAIFYIGNNDYGKGLKKTFQKKFESLGGQVVMSESHLSGSRDFKTQLVKIKSNNPDVIYLPTQTQEVGLIVKQARELGINIPIIGTETMHDDQFLNVAGDNAEGVIFTSFSEYKGQEAKDFLANYKEKFSENEKGIYSDYAYDAVYAIAQAMKDCKNIKPECVKNNLNSVSFTGATGPVSFDDNGDVQGKDFSVFKVEDGNFVREK